MVKIYNIVLFNQKNGIVHFLEKELEIAMLREISLPE